MHKLWQDEFTKGTPNPGRCHQGGVEKLQAAQQLTATLLLSSTVNVMLSQNDICFQCQELGHMACHCPNIRCFDFNKYGHVAADCPDKIPPSGTPVCHGKHHPSMRHQTRSTSQHIHSDRHRFHRCRSHSHSQIQKSQLQ